MADLFAQINNVVLDLQASDHQSYERPLRALVALLEHPELADVNKRLTADVDLDAFLKESAATQSGMVGSATLAWPPERPKQLGLILLLLSKFAEQPRDMFQFGFTFCHAGGNITSNVHAVVRQLIIPFQRDYKEFVLSQGNTDAKVIRPVSNKVFVVHGHDEGARESVARFLSTLGLIPIILHEQANAGRTIIEKFEGSSDVGFAVVILTPDDEGRSRQDAGELRPRARQNVLLELGYFIGVLGRSHVCALRKGEVDIPSDFAGVVWVEMDAARAWRFSLAAELREAGFKVDLNNAI